MSDTGSLEPLVYLSDRSQCYNLKNHRTIKMKKTYFAYFSSRCLLKVLRNDDAEDLYAVVAVADAIKKSGSSNKY